MCYGYHINSVLVNTTSEKNDFRKQNLIHLHSSFAEVIVFILTIYVIPGGALLVDTVFIYNVM